MSVISQPAASGAFEWTDITGPTEDELNLVSLKYGLSQYTLRDCLEPDHLPKSEDLGDIHFIISRILVGARNNALTTVQEISTKVAIFYNSSFIITVHRLPHPFLDKLRKESTGNTQPFNTSDLVTRILWHVLQSYNQPAIDLSDEVDNYEVMMFHQPLTPTMMQDLHFIKQRASICRKLLMLTGEILSSVRSAGTETAALQDVRDLHVKLIMLFEQVHEDVTNLLNIYLSLSAQKTNQVIKVLTLFSVFFMPLTFIVGIYGMNFEFMPELKARWGYPAVMLGMAAITLAIYIWFKRRKWM